jgi:ATP-dependent RNA helicase DDX52/ROK1
MINIWRKHNLKVDGSDLPCPIEHFSSLGRPPLNAPQHVVDVLFERNHKIPTPVQVQAIPTLLSGRDLLACAPTGSGKTLAYLIPLFARLREPSSTAGVRALVVAPTMELAVQIEREAFFLMKGARWKLVQHGQTTKNKDIFITTPQRVVTMLENKNIDLSHVEFLVFDEGDKLWEPSAGFLPLTDRIVAGCTKTDKVVALFTATLSEKVEEAARSVMASDAVSLIVRGRTVANKDVEQRLVFCGNELGKVVAMRNLIREGLRPPVLIFLQSIERTKELADELRCGGLPLAIMNSNMSREEREATVTSFRLGKIWVLITTELLSRGIDFKHVGTVINFDFPTTTESYIHRIGRTGRAGNKGLAITFFTEEDRERLPPVVKIAVESGAVVDEWMLHMKVPKKRQRQLARQTPQRMIVSTQKRILVGEQRIQRQIAAAERERAAARASGSPEEASDDEDA